MTDFSELKNKTITEIIGASKDNTEITFICSDGTKYRMHHEQDCCESVWLEDVIGNVEDLLNSPILMAEEVSDGGNSEPLCEDEDSYSWTFYKLATIKGYVTLRWYGRSNGYYSESVDFVKILK